MSIDSSIHEKEVAEALRNLLWKAAQIVPYVIYIKRLRLLFSVVIGGLWFQEPQLRRRLSGTAIMVAGAMVILFFS